MKSTKTAVTVLLPVYNGEGYLNECIDSVLNQTFTDYELLIIDDASTDKSSEIIRTYNNNKIRLVDNKNNIGLTQTLNKGINLAKSKYIARLDQDDISHKTRLALQVEFLFNNPDIALLGTNCEYIDSQNRIIGKWETPKSHYEIINSIHERNPFAHSSVMFDRKKIINIGCYPINYIYAQDLALWIKICSKYKVANLNNFVTKIRIHNQQATFNKKLQKLKSAEELSITKNSLNIPGLTNRSIFQLYIKIFVISMVNFKNNFFNKLYNLGS